MRSVVMCGVLIVASAVAAPCDAAAMITTATGKGADTYVANDEKIAPTKSQGGAKMAEVRQLNGTPSRSRITYLRFDLSSVSGDKSGATLTLSMYKAANRARPLTVYGLTDGEDDRWPESTMSYSTAPGLKSASLGSSSIDGGKLTKLGTIAFAEQDKSKTSSTTDLPLDGFLKSDTNGLITLVLVDDSSDADGQEDYYIDTKEGKAESAPRLTFPNATGGDPPTPTTPTTLPTAPASQPATRPHVKASTQDPGLP